MAVVDKPRDLIYWYYPSAASSGELDSVLIYNYRTDRWGKQARAITAALQYSSGQIRYEDLGTLDSTYDDLPDHPHHTTFVLTASQTRPGFLDPQLSRLHSAT